MNNHSGCSVLVVTLTLFVLLFAGCGGSNVTMTPDYMRKELHDASLKREQLRIVDVTDARKRATPQIGVAHVGMFNKAVPYTLTGVTSDVVRTMLDTLLVVHKERQQYVPLSVAIDVFEVGERTTLFSEEGYFTCNLRFMYPVRSDSIATKTVFSKKTYNGMDVTNSLESLVYEGIAQCARTFVIGMFDKDSVRDVPYDSLQKTTRQLAQTALPTSASQPTVKQGSFGSTARSNESNEISFHYIGGVKIRTGIRGTYSFLYEKDGGRFKWGLGVALTYFDVDNTKDHYTGTFVNYGGRLLGRYFLSDGKISAFAGLGLGLAGGTERIGYGTFREESFFFGPDFVETIGVSIDRKFMLEAGAFQIVYFGSKLLPDDVGFTAGMSFTL